MKENRLNGNYSSSLAIAQLYDQVRWELKIETGFS